MHPRPRPRAILAGLALACLLVAPHAQAHAIFVRSTPANGALLADPPARVNVTYNEAIREIRVADVLDGNGSSVRTAPATVAADSDRVVQIPTGNLSPGIYTTTWAVASADAHNVSGAFFFIVGSELPGRQQVLGRVQAPGDDAPLLDPVEPPLSALVLVATALLVGVPVAGRWAIRPVLGRGPPGRRRRLLTVAATGLPAGAGLLLLHRGPAATPAAFAAGVQVAAGLGALSVLALARDRWHGAAAVAAGLLAAAGVTTTSHSATLAGTAGYLVDLAHVLAAGLWLGGLVGLACLGAPRLKDRDDAAEDARRLIRRVSPLLLAGLGLAAVAGLLLAAWHVPDPPRLADTLYGRVLSVKTLLVVSAIGLAAFHRLVLHDRLGGGDGRWRDRFTWTVRLEALVLVAVVVASATMTAAPTGVAARQLEETGPQARTGRVHYAGPLGGEQVSTFLDVRLEVTPTGPGLNVLDARILRDGQPVPDVGNVTVDPVLLDRDVDLPPVHLDRRGPGNWSAVTALPLEGRWSLALGFSVNGTLKEVAWTVPVRPAGGPPTAGLATGPWVGRLRAAALLAGIAALGVHRWERRRDAGPGPL